MEGLQTWRAPKLPDVASPLEEFWGWQQMLGAFAADVGRGVRSLMKPKPLKKASDSECLPSSEGQYVSPRATWINTWHVAWHSWHVVMSRDHKYVWRHGAKNITMWLCGDYITSSQGIIGITNQEDMYSHCTARWGRKNIQHVPYAEQDMKHDFFGGNIHKPEKHWCMTGKRPKLRVAKAVMMHKILRCVVRYIALHGNHVNDKVVHQDLSSKGFCMDLLGLWTRNIRWDMYYHVLASSGIKQIHLPTYFLTYYISSCIMSTYWLTARVFVISTCNR